MTSLSNYPFLDQHEFRLICEDFAASFEERKTDAGDWQNVQCRTVDSECLLRISRAATAAGTRQPRKVPEDPNAESVSAEIGVEEFDEEALPRHLQAHGSTQQDGLNIEYDILLSPSYSVPILYFLVRDCHGQLVTDLEEIYLLLVPEVYRHQMRHIGIMGGLSTTSHPITDVPAFFIHPCQTADALREVAGKRTVLPREYMMMWMGIIGGSVGLNAPLSLGIQQT